MNSTFSVEYTLALDPNTQFLTAQDSQDNRLSSPCGCPQLTVLWTIDMRKSGHYNMSETKPTETRQGTMTIDRERSVRESECPSQVLSPYLDCSWWSHHKCLHPNPCPWTRNLVKRVRESGRNAGNRPEN